MKFSRGLTRYLGAAALAASFMFGASIAQAEATPGQDAPCPLENKTKIITAAQYTMSPEDRCHWVIFANSGAISVQLPAPDGLLFRPNFSAHLLLINGGSLTLTTAARINLANTLAVSGSGAELRVMQDMNWWALLTGGGSGGLSGMTPGQVPLAASPTTVASSFPLGSGIQTALGIAVGSAGAPVTNGGALGTPSSGTATNLTGTASGLTAGHVTDCNATTSGGVPTPPNDASKVLDGSCGFSTPGLTGPQQVWLAWAVGSLSAHTCNAQTVLVGNARARSNSNGTTDPVSVGPPIDLAANLLVSARVSAAGVVEVRVCNPTTGTIATPTTDGIWVIALQ